MALRKIVVQGDECLSKVCRPVTEFNAHLHQLLDDMTETLEDANGAGLAAPQVGVLRRVCVVLDEGSEEFIELVNPEIVAQSGEQTGLEGCLSVPGKWGIVTRPDVVRVRAQDRYGDWFEVPSAMRSSTWMATCSWSTSTTSCPTRSSGTIWSRRSGRPGRPRKLRKGSEPMRILFMGTPDFAVASLRRLVADGHEICGVFSQPDKPKNRGHKLVPTPVKEYALTQNIPVYQPEKLRDGTALELVRSLAPELTVVAAYGRILPEDILEAPKYGSINVHSSLLPKYRGAAPINWAILNGEETTGGAGGGGPQRGCDGHRRGDFYPDAPGRGDADLRLHADEGNVSYRLDPLCPGDRLPGPGADPLALRGLHAGRAAVQGFPDSPWGPDGRSTGHGALRREAGHPGGLRWGRESLYHGAPGRGRQAHGRRRLSAGTPAGGLSPASFTIREVFYALLRLRLLQLHGFPGQ